MTLPWCGDTRAVQREFAALGRSGGARSTTPRRRSAHS
uniref:Uncharacterized protein n=1 Tax=viral metagenome TaxID=1070528 RepID=A0A6C0ATD9_9ZZZZ